MCAVYFLDLWWVALYTLLSGVTSLKDVVLQIEPSVVQFNGSSTLSCTYDLEGDGLYSVKWYRGGYEFYRYVPGDTPDIKYFGTGELKPDLTKSNSTQVVLTEIEFNLAGNFSCEVTTDGPNIHTRVDSKSMSVVLLPEHPPQISVGREPLDVGDILKANCTSYPSRPPADLKFILNNLTVNQTNASIINKSNKLDWSDLQLVIKLTALHFSDGRLMLKCIALIPPIYHEEAELELESLRRKASEPARVSAPSSAAFGMSSGRIASTIRRSAISILLAFGLLLKF
ncbi:uncharacterized protein LOC126745564 [Anthonomus grandis grandis]|uniref:uncharacterized protein LOC126745564 n=1 Tax=Anthonomus grandis grandis TaxID=2921223 RepID=UPI0021665901|nr:uncharacterized protein LOC126745564 [Anthonomus grandis grandis]